MLKMSLEESVGIGQAEKKQGVFQTKAHVPWYVSPCL